MPIKKTGTKYLGKGAVLDFYINPLEPKMNIEEVTVTPKEKKKLDSLLKMAKTKQEERLVYKYWTDWCAYWKKKRFN